MTTCHQISHLPMTCETFDAAGNNIGTKPMTWYGFSQEVEDRMEPILRPYGYESDSDELPDAGAFLFDIGNEFENTGRPFPWAIIFFHEEYPLGGYLLSIRPNQDICFFSYELMHRQKFEMFNPAVDGPPPLSIVYVFSKSALMDAAATNSPLFKDAWSVLADKPESDNWVVIVDPIDPAWILEASKESDDLFYKLTNTTRSI